MKQFGKKGLIIALAAITAMLFTGCTSTSGKIVEEKVVFTKEQTDSIKECDIDWAAGKLYVEEYEGDHIEAELTYEEKGLIPKVSVQGDKLTVSSDDGSSGFYFGFVHINSGNNYTKAIIRIPSGMKLRELDADIAAGSCEMTAPVSISKKVDIDMAAGSMKIENMSSEEETKLDIAAGSADISGCFTGEVEADLAAGSLNFRNSVSLADTSVQLRVAAGSVEINGQKITGKEREYEDIKENAANKFDAQVAAGSMNVEYDN